MSEINAKTALWDAVQETNPAFTQRANDGRHSFTAVDAYYRVQKATEQWGPYGSTWGLRSLVVSFRDTEKLCLLSAEFFYPEGAFPIMNAIKFESNKGSVDDEFMKKLQTDTLTKALSFLGFAADVFLGKFDDSRYLSGLKAKYGVAEASPGVAPVMPGITPISTPQSGAPKPPPMPGTAPKPPPPMPQKK